MNESQEQIALFQWAGYFTNKYPELELMHHIPNGGKRAKTTAVRLKKEGVVAGVSDVFLPVARSGYHGLYIEMKAKGGKLSDNQKWWIKATMDQGYKSIVCFGWEEARDVIVEYLEVKINEK